MNIYSSPKSTVSDSRQLPKIISILKILNYLGVTLLFLAAIRAIIIAPQWVGGWWERSSIFIPTAFLSAPLLLSIFAYPPNRRLFWPALVSCLVGSIAMVFLLFQLAQTTNSTFLISVPLVILYVGNIPLLIMFNQKPNKNSQQDAAKDAAPLL